MPWRASRRRTVPAETEAGFLRRVKELALLRNFHCYHTLRSKGSDAGFPDLVLTKPGRLLFAELKSQRGSVSADQERWLALLRHSVPGVEVYLWYPNDWDTIVRVLSR